MRSMDVLWHAREKQDVLAEFGVEEVYGLSQHEAEERLTVHGPNTLKEQHRAFWVGALVNQFKSPLVLILFAAFFGALYLHEKLDAAVIALALVLNVVISFIQEYRANRAFEALAASQENETVVLRDGARRTIPVHLLVPGDIVLLSAGAVVPGDGRVIAASHLEVSEAHLTGESLPVRKEHRVVEEGALLYERLNMVYMGSPVLAGEARVVITETANRTEIGDIAAGLSNTHGAETPIEASVRRLARFLSIIVAVVVALLLAVGILRGMPISELILLSIALAVSVVPEGLPAAVTAILAIGMERILKKRGLVRNLLAAETLGSTTIILTDKTGTLTHSRLALVDVVAEAERGFVGVQLSDAQLRILRDAVRVSDAFVENTGDGGTSTVAGNPEERAIMSAALEREVFEDLNKEISKRIDLLSFTSERRFAAALYPHKSGGQAYFIGAPELLLESASHTYENGSVVTLTQARRDALSKTIAGLAHEGKRVIGVATKETGDAPLPRGDSEKSALHGVVFSGLLAFADPVREDVSAALEEVHAAGVRVVMVTGDTPETAYTIAVSAGIAKEGDAAVTGKMIDRMDDEELYRALVHDHHVFARILPTQKKRLVSVLQARGEVVAMTGDGVNDGPALKSAAIGVAVGSGTEVAREAADLVLLDDSFSIIVSAIQEGRRIMDNLKKAVAHLITTSFHEVFIISAAILVGLPLPVLPVQILWVNILEEGFLTFGFAFEPGEKKSMHADPRALRERTILSKQVRRLIIIAGTITGIFSIGIYLFLLSQGLPIEEVRTVMFVVLAIDAIMFAISLKQLHQPFWNGALFNNRYLLFALAFSATGIVATLSIPFLRDLLDLVPLNLFDVLVLIGVALVNLVTIELVKHFTVEEALPPANPAAL